MTTTDELLHGAITCVAAGPDGRIYAGDANGMLRCYARTANTNARETEQAAGRQEAATLQWATSAATTPHAAILSICAIANKRNTATSNARTVAHNDTKVAAAANVLLVVGTAGGELVFFHNDTEARRVQLESAVLTLCAHGHDAAFLAGDAFGMLYGVNQYGILWQERLRGSDSEQQRTHNSSSIRIAKDDPPAFFFPPALHPTVHAIASVIERDVEQTLATYALVSTGERDVLLTHNGHVFARIATPTPVTTIASVGAIGATTATTGGGDSKVQHVVLAAGEAGIVYAITATRTPTFHFTVDVFVDVGFPITKLVAMDDDADALEWLCVGATGQRAHFRGRDRLRTSFVETTTTTTTISKRLESSSSAPVDVAVVRDATSTSLALAFADRIELLRVSSSPAAADAE